MKENILGYVVDTYSVDHCLESILKTLVNHDHNKHECKWLACLNPHSYAVAIGDEGFSQALKSADWLVPDGIGVVMASRLLNGNIRERVTGSDIFDGLLKALNHIGGHTVFFLGSTEDTLYEIRKRMTSEYPNVKVVGTYSPPFKHTYSQSELDAMVSAINDAAPDVLWVGMTAPKQEKWIHDQSYRLNAKFAAAVGAVFDFYAGNVKRAHPTFQRLGLEWFIRSIQEPRRLWRRHYVSAPIFVGHVLKAAIKRKLT